MAQSKIIGIIPARYGSTRFPGKMLTPIAGKSLIQHTWENAQHFPQLQDLVVATDDERIYKHVQNFGGKVVMTPVECLTGTDRLAAVMREHPQYQDADIVVNIQGDDPGLPVDVVEKLTRLLTDDQEAAMATAVCPLSSLEEANDPSVVKCVMDIYGNALYFSRALIPAGHSLSIQTQCKYYRHLGVYAYRADFLLRYAQLEPTSLQLAEDLEQLKILEHGYRIKVTTIPDLGVIGVNLPEDVAKIESQLCAQASFSSREASVHH